MPIGYRNQSTVWFLGGRNINVNGYGTGTLDGNGQMVWPPENLIDNSFRTNYPLTVVRPCKGSVKLSGKHYVYSQ
jgi:galacturan 1,4-alpha-galacturonidase